MSRSSHSLDEAAWSALVAEHHIGDVVEGLVVSIVPFGAFIRVAGVDGLAPKSAWPVLPELDSLIRVRITAIDLTHRRLAFDPS
jgi:exoribonuclease R